MRFIWRYPLLLSAVFALTVACDEKVLDEILGSYAFIIQQSNIEVESTSDVIVGAYSANRDNAVEVGVCYSEAGSTTETYVPAAELATKFTVTLTGLTPETTYTIHAYLKTSGGKIVQSEQSWQFTTSGDNPEPEPEPEPAVTQFQWVELPVLKEMDDIVYVTHYVTSNGENDASPTTKGRVRNYTICYDKEKLQPLWVAAPMHSWYNGSVDRSNAWNYDPYISHSKQPDLSSSYKSNGDGSFSRGHMVASSDRLRTTALNKQTFYFTNMSPQTQNSFNGGIWEKLEKKVLAWGDDTSDTLYVVSGTAFIGTLKTVKDNNGKVLPVPSNYYKVLLSSKSGKTGKSIGQLSASELKCVGFWLDHFGHSNTDKPSASDMMSVADIEAKTGFTFFPMLSESAKSVKENYKASDWGM